jgi:hypothetical protein
MPKKSDFQPDRYKTARHIREGVIDSPPEPEEEELVPDRPQKRGKRARSATPAEHLRENIQLSSKGGKQSGAKKNHSSRYGTSSMPATRRVAGAFGKEEVSQKPTKASR